MQVLIGGSLIPKSTDTPINARSRIDSINQVETITQPAVGETFYCKDTKTLYVIDSLKSKSINGFEIPNSVVDAYHAIGESGHDKTYYFEQTTASDTWEIIHNLNKYPNVTAIDTTNRQIFGGVEYKSLNKLIINFSAATAGSATLN